MCTVFYTHMLSLLHTYTCTHIHVFSLFYIYTCALFYTRMHTHIHVCSLTHMCSLSHTHVVSLSHTQICMHRPCVKCAWHLWSSEEGIVSAVTGVLGGSEPSCDMGAGSQSLVLCKDEGQLVCYCSPFFTPCPESIYCYLHLSTSGHLYFFCGTGLWIVNFLSFCVKRFRTSGV